MSDVSLPVSYRTLEAPVHVEWVEKKSRFLCALFPAATEHAVQQQLALLRKQYWDATHHCSAFRLKDGTERAHDDGEPAGTAGRPMLHVLQQHDLVDVCAVVTRYFGGTLLGAGGLVRAYSHSVVRAIEAATLLSIAPHDLYHLTLDYSQYDFALHRLREAGWEVAASFTDRVTLTVIAPTAVRETAIPMLTSLAQSPVPIVPVQTELRALHVTK
ncbi:IMPACT family protein [Sulfoacidibacillus thermotolerans]|uniref:Impact N-terminal domain-containing protein n=1 Tax=Sulfoacidibacillus thermotolerans TaxID=1765684 RepID=A0A2U3D652_SULT2|nr:YigZ family protein [Sulfoacidibacillus thermotolerans]PWI56754.1 hypothetical protein BM613_12060 [Sulfoacidibacillus thermotolerans]